MKSRICHLLCLSIPIGAGGPLAGCATAPSSSSEIRSVGGVATAGPAAQLPAPILHVVFIRLKDPLDTAALSHDSLEMTAQIPSVVSAFVGLHLDTGRDAVVRDYDLCMAVGFDDHAGYQQYLDHPAHTAVLSRWRSRIEWLRIYDARDVRP